MLSKTTEEKIPVFYTNPKPFYIFKKTSGISILVLATNTGAGRALNTRERKLEIEIEY